MKRGRGFGPLEIVTLIGTRIGARARRVLLLAVMAGLGAACSQPAAETAAPAAARTAFAATGNPNRADLPAWPAFDPPAGMHLDLGETVAVGEGLHEAAGRLFRRFAASRRAGM